jgi:hypothetical protein
MQKKSPTDEVELGNAVLRPGSQNIRADEKGDIPGKSLGGGPELSVCTLCGEFPTLMTALHLVIGLQVISRSEYEAAF